MSQSSNTTPAAIDRWLKAGNEEAMRRKYQLANFMPGKQEPFHYSIAGLAAYEEFATIMSKIATDA